MSEKIQEANCIVKEVTNSEYIYTKKEEKPLPLGVKIAIVIASIMLVVSLMFVVVWDVVTYDWRQGNKPVPSFLMDIGMFQGSSFRYFDGITVNGVDIGNMSEKRAVQAINDAQNLKKLDYNITFVAADKKSTLSGKDIALLVETDEVLNEAKEYCISVMQGKASKENKYFNAEVFVDKTTMSAVFESLALQLHCDPVDATFEGIGEDGLIFVPHIDGIDVDENTLTKDIENFLRSGKTEDEISVTPAKTTPAKITTESLKQKIKLIGTHSTYAGNVANSNANMKKAMQMCNGSVIEPGGIWSFNACTGNSNLPSGGWLPSTVIMAGEYVQGYGGGICQASTTIYNAALYANMQVVTRYNHAYPSTYAKGGLDATIDYPGKDLKLQNKSAYPMYIQCIMVGKKLTVNIYGCPDYSFDKITLSTNTEETVEGSHYIVAAYRHYWKNGVIFKTQQLHSSRYIIKAEEEEEETPTPEPTPEPTPTPESENLPTTDNPDGSTVE